MCILHVCMCVYMYGCVYVCMCVYLYVDLHVDLYMYMYMSVHISILFTIFQKFFEFVSLKIYDPECKYPDRSHCSKFSTFVKLVRN